MNTKMNFKKPNNVSIFAHLLKQNLQKCKSI